MRQLGTGVISSFDSRSSLGAGTPRGCAPCNWSLSNTRIFIPRHRTGAGTGIAGMLRLGPAVVGTFWDKQPGLAGQGAAMSIQEPPRGAQRQGSTQGWAPTGTRVAGSPWGSHIPAPPRGTGSSERLFYGEDVLSSLSPHPN